MDALHDRPILPPAPVAATTTDSLEAGALGFLVAGSVAAIVASVAWWLSLTPVAVIAAIGIPIGAVLAAAAGRRLAGPRWFGTAVGLGLVAPLVPAALIVAYVVIAALPALADGAWNAILGGVGVSLIVICYAEIFGAPVAVPVSVVAGFLVRRAARMPADRARRHVAALVIVAVALAAVTLILTGWSPYANALGMPGD
jgi:hypothetical protein